jgi:4-amino-4-deoxy-L-arabinose transferase-like glycosyltransferase
VSEPAARRRALSAAAVVFAVAVVVRLGYVAWLGFDFDEADLRGDDVDYYTIAVNVANGDGFSRTWQGAGPDHGELVPTAYRTPLWPVTEAVVYRLASPSPTLGRLLTVVIDAFGCVLLLWLGWRLRGPTVGLVAGLAAAVYPPIWIYVGGLFSEPMMTFTVVLALLAADRYRERGTTGRAAALGVALGLVTLARPNGLVIAMLLVPWVLWLGRDRLAAAARAAGVVVLATLVVVAPWLVYASARMGEFVPVTTQGGVLLAGDFNDTVIDTSHPRWGYWDYDLIISRLFTSRSEEDWNHTLFEVGKDWIRDNPGGTVKAIALRTVRYFDTYWRLDQRTEVGIPTERRKLNVLVVFSWWVAFVLAAVAVARLRRRGELAPWVPAFVVFGALAIAGMLLGGATRYRAPAEPIVVLLAATLVVEVVRDRVSARTSADRQPGSVPTPVAP